GSAATVADDPVAVVAALAAAVKADDGAALDRLLHPDFGLWLWTQPGAVVAPAVKLDAGGGAPPSARLPADGADFNDYWREHYWQEVVAGIEAGLARLDRAPADVRAPVYGDCGEPERTDLRAYLIMGADLGYRVELARELGVTFDPRAARGLTHFARWGLDVFLVRDRGRWWVAHVMVWTPCDA
ncbi:MAG TPA: hypothetical protein VM734_26905, partial [Kofleriaceae bacterium]|nr:hypothetical protein [Kofleriaceae bacterium]